MDRKRTNVIAVLDNEPTINQFNAELLWGEHKKNGLPGIECMTKEETNNDMSQIQQYSAAILATRDELLDWITNK